MKFTIKKYWNLIIRLGSDELRDYKQQIRLYTLNAFAFIWTVIILFFVAIFTLLGSTSAIEGLFFVPILLMVLWLNSQKKSRTAKGISVFLLAIVVLVLAIWDRRTGTEYILVAVACSSILIFEDFTSILFGFIWALICFGFYSWYDRSYPFVADPNVPYTLVKNVISICSAVAVLIQLLVFRALINSYALELERAHQLVISTNEELKSSNQELHSLSKQLDWIVKQKSSELQSYLDAINVHVCSIVTDLDGTFLKVNDPFATATGYTKEELVGKNFNILNSGYHSTHFLKRMLYTLKIGKTWRGEVKNKRKDGLFFWIDMVVIPLKSERGVINYFLTLALPITERKEAEEQKEKTSKMLEDIAFKASHTVRGPIARIQGLMNLMDSSYIAKDEMASITRFLKESVAEMDEATRELTSFVNTHYEEDSSIRNQNIFKNLDKTA